MLVSELVDYLIFTFCLAVTTCFWLTHIYSYISRSIQSFVFLTHDMEDSQRKHAGSKGFRALENRKQDIAYNHYLNSFVKLEDRRYLPNDNVIHQLVPLRAAVGTIVMTPTQFNEVHFSPLGTCFYFSENNVPNDPLTMALLEREKLNATKTISV